MATAAFPTNFITGLTAERDSGLDGVGHDQEEVLAHDDYSPCLRAKSCQLRSVGGSWRGEVSHGVEEDMGLTVGVLEKLSESVRSALWQSSLS